MVLVLELVGVGVLGACLSVLLCIIAGGTPRGVLRVADSEANSTESRISQCLGKRSEANRCTSMTKNLIENGNSAIRKLRPSGQKELEHKSDISVESLYLDNKMTAVNTENDAAENPLSIENPEGSTDAGTKLCNYCRTYKAAKDVKNLLGTKIFTKKSENGMKSARIPVKYYEESKKINNHEWRKVRTKKRKFLLPQTFVIDSKVKNNKDIHAFPDDFYERIICRHCYLEALKIKANKVGKNSTDL